MSCHRQIRELRSLSTSNQQVEIHDESDLESKLWDDIKIGSFTQLFVTIYMVSAICVLLFVQMHMLAKTSEAFVKVTNDEEFDKHSEEADSQIFRDIIEGTFKHIFGTGLRTLASIIRQQVTTDLRDWTIKDKTSVEYVEFVHTMNNIRRSIESDLTNLIRVLMIRKLYLVL